MNRKHINDYSSKGWCFDMRCLIKALDEGNAEFIYEYLTVPRTRGGDPFACFVLSFLIAIIAIIFS